MTKKFFHDKGLTYVSMNNCNVPTSYYLLSFLVYVLLKLLFLTNIHDTWCELRYLPDYLVLLLPKGNNMCIVLNFSLFFILALWAFQFNLIFAMHFSRYFSLSPKSNQPFILLRSIKWVPGIAGNLVVKSKLPPRSGSSLEAVAPHPKKRGLKVFFNYLYTYSILP